MKASNEQLGFVGNPPKGIGTILCVEDEPDLREVLVEELEDVGYVVIQAGNGKEAWALLEHTCPDLILCDIAMPGMDGYALLREIRENRPDLSEVPFVFLSAQDGSGQITRGKYAGADDYLVKPINFDLMLATIAARIRQMRRVQSLSAGIPASQSLEQTSDMAERLYQGVVRTLDMVGTGIILLNSAANVILANPAVLQLEATGVYPDLSRILWPTCPSSVLRKHAVIAAAVESSLLGQEQVELLSIAHAQGERDLLVSVCSLVQANAMPSDPVVALFVSGGNRNEVLFIRHLGALFQLTPTEAKIASAFSQGLRSSEIAAAFDISLTTVAFHKRNIFQKTRTNREADLIALLLTLPVCAV